MAKTFINGGVDNNYSTSGNWNPAGAPTSADDVIFDASSPNCVVDVNSAAKTITTTGYTGTLSGSANLSLYGSASFVAGMGFTWTGIITFLASGTLTSGGKTFNRVNPSTGAAGTFQLGDALSMTGYFTHSSGAFVSNNYSITATQYATSGTTAKSVDWGTSTVTLTGTASVLNAAATANLTVTSTNHTLVISNNSTSTKTLTGGGLTWGNLSISAGGTGAIIFTGGDTFKDLTVSAPKTLRFTISTTTTFTGTISSDASASNAVTINTGTAGTAATISKAAGTVSVDWWSIKDSTATGGATFYAGANSTNVSGNSGWIFTAPPTTTYIPKVIFFN